MSDAVSWIRLQTALGAGAAINEVIEYFGSAENLFAAGETEWRMSPVLVPRQTERLCQSSRQQAEEVLAECAPITINMLGRAESLNASVAGTIVMWEMLR